MNEKRYKEVSFFGFKLNHTSAVILFVLVITSLIGSIPTIYNYILLSVSMFPISSLDELIILLISFFLLLMSLAVMGYTLFRCLKMRFVHLNDDFTVEHLFGFDLNKTSAAILFLTSLIGLIGFPFAAFALMFNIIYTIDIFLDYARILNILIPAILNLIILIFIVFIYAYTIRKCISILKETKIEKERSKSESKKKNAFFGFELNETSGMIIFIDSLIAIISLIPPIIISIINYLGAIIQFMDHYPLIYLILNTSSFISILIFLGIYRYSITSSINLKKNRSNNKTEGIRLFGFEMNTTSASILYLISILGIIGFLTDLQGFINMLISIWRYIDNPFELFIPLLTPIIFFILNTFFLSIYIHIILKCVKVRNLII